MYHVQSLPLSQPRIRNVCNRSNSKRNSIIACNRSDATVDASEGLSFDSELGSSMDHCNSDHSTSTRPPTRMMGYQPQHLKSCLAGKSQQNDTSNSNSTKSKSIVRFDKVELRECELILSDNSCITSSPAIGLGWSDDPNGTVQSSIDSYEADRHRHSCIISISSMNKNNDLHISPGERVAMLLRVGYSPVEIRESLKERRSRRNSSLKYQQV